MAHSRNITNPSKARSRIRCTQITRLIRWSEVSTPYDKFGTPEEYSIVCTTYRLTEQYHYWTKTIR